MATPRAGALIALVFLTALVAGGAAGMLVARYVAPPRSPQPVVTGELPLSEELQLNPAQRDQIRQIWESVRAQNDASFNQGEMLQHLRDDQILKLLNDDQRREFARVNQEYTDRFTALTAKRESTFNEAVAKTKQVLTESQRRRYDAILARRLAQPGSTTRPAPAFPAASRQQILRPDA